MDKKRHLFDIKLNSIMDSDNPTRNDCEFILHDFELSHNNAFISKETAQKTLHTLKGMPIVCKYNPVTEAGAKDDAMGSHEVYLGENRETGETIIELKTAAIGVFTEDAYITTIKDENGNDKEVVAGKGILWASRFPNAIGLLKEWMNSGVEVVSSMEILYDSYIFKDGKEEILSYVYEGHCILNSEERGNHNKVYPAYDVSKLTKLVAQAVNQEDIMLQQSGKEGENMENFKKIFELSHDDVRTLIYNELDPKLGERTYSWVADVFDTYFVANVYSFAEGDEYDKYFKFDYTKSENAIEIDMESKTEVFLKRNWEEVISEEIQAQLNEKETKIGELETQLNEVIVKKEEVEVKFNETTEILTQLNSQVEELKPFKEQIEKEAFEKALNEKKEFYSAKFKALNATEKFDDEEVQELVKKSVFENEESKQAVLQLNTMLVDLVQVQQTITEEVPVVRELSSRRENLIPTGEDFESRYGL